MKIEKATTVITLSEDDLKEAIEYWLMVQHNTKVEIKYLEHLCGTRSEGYGGLELDVPYQEGVKLQVVDKPSDVYYR